MKLYNLRMSSRRQDVREKFVCGREVKLTTTIDTPVKDVDCLDTMFEHAVVDNPLQCCLLTLNNATQEPFQQLDIGNLNGGSGPKRTRVRNVVCINCSGNHYRKTPCRVPIID
ncbi:hypothetical protein BASA50_010994 [Batrachochytrium salamandrivorans]|uniref:Uncharacterized protein n=1 Tax=Batrachochytrium salamandrivorans TaxID=1357716 RepID=A0ABQ8EX36_9FUNG|nr:hypothetical protein BASA62_008190 [Batrachochytrium salamandrivorans]KAH6585463.1 hypothetical protein BASA61_006810 [Batrachochytrium salamandrivorans]KAH6587975.1 hypothetical protein BASA50_010994 [Batrachochytrium salamandrivorans]KAH9270522.1 hypothetical protein BASA83_007334 [Batrachochytrium salamandrivorans]